MNMIQGSFSFAYPNISLIILPDSPIYLSTIAELTTLMKFVSRVAATALANRVLPVPGGPYNSTPFGGLMPILRNSSGLTNGNSITSRRARICSLRPPMESKLILPGDSMDMLYTRGSTSRGRIRIMVKVVISKDTRIP
eukprot:NODE_143_length_17796_cov_0.252020.p10 type:complete len:139 gc:universal NODE_143_length_17796_cov_0.252020:3577-3993(+)